MTFGTSRKKANEAALDHSVEITLPRLVCEFDPCVFETLVLCRLLSGLWRRFNFLRFLYYHLLFNLNWLHEDVDSAVERASWITGQA